MGEITQELRKAIMSHVRRTPKSIHMALVEEVKRLEGEITGLRATIDRQHQRHDSQIADLRRDIERLKGTHGA